ncbi:GAP family protein [Nocardioides euryhalodurans]|uniref:GAP family protein n=1 Tax=Nocardioides euryhalodurans TaxID=2518370 RepID=A0A4P7GNQ0_9ACTN|nr:GAP family protein [Nocardioides euryhalodurans]QBR93835.1 hypothetical protein EXE57_17265 [Nocardioides euryhalodurans]
MTWELGGTLLGLAALDSLNPATIVAIILILLGSRRHPIGEALGFVFGAFASVFLVGLAVYFGAEAAAESITGALTWLRRGAFGLAALVLFLSAARSLRTRRRSAIELPDWFTPTTAAGLGIIMTGADLPNAFPYFIAIERLLTADVSSTTAVLVLVAYGVVYCLPCLVLLAVGLNHGERVVTALRRLFEQFGTEATLPPSPKRALTLFVLGLMVLAIAFTI